MAYGTLYAIGIDEQWIKNALHQWDIGNKKPHFIPIEHLLKKDNHEYQQMIKLNEKYLAELKNKPVTNLTNKRKNQVIVNLRSLKKHLQLSETDRFDAFTKNISKKLISKTKNGYLSDENRWGKFDFYTNVINNSVEPFDKIEFVDTLGHINHDAINLENFAPKSNPIPDALLLPDGIWHENFKTTSYYRVIDDVKLVYPKCLIYAYGYHI